MYKFGIKFKNNTTYIFNMEIVDHDFYTSFYQDLKHMTPRESQKHYLHYGRKEKHRQKGS